MDSGTFEMNLKTIAPTNTVKNKTKETRVSVN